MILQLLVTLFTQLIGNLYLYFLNFRGTIKTGNFWIQTIVSLIFSVYVFLILKNISTNLLDFTRFMIAYELLLVIAIIDYRIKMIPNILILLGSVLQLVLFFPIEFIYMKANMRELLISSMLGCMMGGGILLLVYFISRHAIGMGDVKLVSLIGFLFGGNFAFSVLLSGITLAAIMAFVLLLVKRKTKNDTIPFAPFLLMGYIATIAYI